MIKRIFERISKVNPQKATIIFLVLTSLLLASSITLTVFFAIDKSKYQTTYGTFLNNPEDGQAIRYVVKGEGYQKSIRNVPGNWKNLELVEIEYIKDEPESVRARRDATPYIIAVIASLAAGGWAVYMFLKYVTPNKGSKPNTDNTPTAVGGYYS